MTQRNYPSTVLEVIDDDMRFRAAALQAVHQFSESSPWSGSLTERKEKFRKLNQALAEAYNIAEPDLCFGRIDGSNSSSSHFIPAHNRIVLVGKLSVVTYLHEFAHARGMGERGACRWSINVFRRIFPDQYARLISRGHMLIRPQSVSRDGQQSHSTETE